MDQSRRQWAARPTIGAIAAEVLALREERAKLFWVMRPFAAYKLETEMAGTPYAVRDLLMQGLGACPRAGRTRMRPS